ncbi:MAG TPA: hypothetical protein DDW49_00935 [Deltaproteobacteria bacterium]|nr:MAG: hypothetical protein A2048_07640 [Deltaproteobacteria bacterium GWA2_45_12]HBF11949.1 hypothetical protein [Deltaproteobacteria bacterium]
MTRPDPVSFKEPAGYAVAHPYPDEEVDGIHPSQTYSQYKETTLAPVKNQPRKFLLFPANKVREEKKYTQVDTGSLSLDPKKVVQSERLGQTLMDVLPLPSKSCQEKIFVQHAKQVFENLGLRVSVDDLPAQVAQMNPKDQKDFYCNEGTTQPESGNLIAFLPATDASLPSWNLNFHFDTLQTSFEGIARQGDIIRPAKATPLGADDKAGFAILVETLRVIQENRIPHGDIRIVGLVGEEDTGGGALLISADHFKEDVLVSVDGTDPNEIGRAAPTMYKGYVAIQTHTSHPFAVDKQKSVSACAVGTEFKLQAGFKSDAHPSDHPNVVLHTYFESCGVDGGKKTDFGVPLADPKYNTIAPFWTAAWQMRNLEGPEKAAQMAAGLKGTLQRVCQQAAEGRTPVACEITGTDKPSLVGYVVPEEDPGISLLQGGFESVGMSPEVTARQFGGFNGNHIHSRFGAKMVIIGTGASNYIHTDLETASVSGMTHVAQGLLAAMLESYRYQRD